jgi:DNA-binding NtrC family response regulator
MLQGQKQTVLVFETDPSLRRLITLGLVHRGFQVIEADSLTAIDAMDVATVDLLVLDVDSTVTCDWQLLESIQSQPCLSSIATIVLAWEAPLTGSSAIALSMQDQNTFLPKPFDARTLYETIDDLIAARFAEQKAREALLETALLASYARHTAPSVWPVITAAGLLIVVIGLLLHFVLAIVGILIVIAGLLLWTLGGSPAPASITLGVSQP